MPIVLYGTKLGMTRVFQGDLETPVTVVRCEPNVVIEVKTAEKHGYAALRVACGPKKRDKNLTRPIAGEFKKKQIAPRRFLREIPMIAGKEVGAEVTVEILKAGAGCHVTGTSKGHGFAGVMKRHNFSGYPRTHGHGGRRWGGSVGARMDPGKTHKNKKMAGHFGCDRVTVRNLSIVKVDPTANLVLIKGSIPGSIGGLVSIQQEG